MDVPGHKSDSSMNSAHFLIRTAGEKTYSTNKLHDEFEVHPFIGYTDHLGKLLKRNRGR